MDYKQSTISKFSRNDCDLIENSDNHRVQIEKILNGELNKPINDEQIDFKLMNGQINNQMDGQLNGISNGISNGRSKEDESKQMIIENRLKINGIIQTNKSDLNDELDKNNDVSNLNKKLAKNAKRDDYLIWEDYFMSVALLSAKRSKDPSTQVGACIVNNDNKIISIGYNGMPINCNDDLLPWGKSSINELDNKYLYVCHAELNCVLNSNAFNLKDCTIYVTLFPCNECAKVIIQVGIKKICYLDRKKEEKPEYIASKRLLDMANVKLIHYKPKETEVVLKLKVN